jgi:hypothetical protein
MINRKTFFILCLVNFCIVTIESTAQTTLVNAQTAFKIENKTIGNCKQPVPVDWLNTTNPQGSALDLFDANHTMYAGWAVLPVNSRLAAFYDRELYNANPERSVLRIANMIGGGTFNEKSPIVYTTEINEQINGYVLRSVAGGAVKGIVFYKVYPGDNVNYNYIESIRVAFTKAELWEQKGELVFSIAAGINCTTVNTPSELPSLPKRSSLKSSVSKSKKDEYGYNVQLGTEYCHNPRTGENFRVSPSTNWSETGPDGPGYYGMAGNERIKMSPGRSN